MDIQESTENMTDRFQITVTLSKKAYEQFREVAEWKEIPVATLIRQILEREHESPAFANLYKRASVKE
jgi:predicted DNA-binding ribbon-helix-helix protein